jgi:cell wall-associated NlpC family hydrolase
MSRESVIAEAEKWLGASWRHQARVRYIACDCGQLLVDVFQQCGLISADIVIERYSRQWSLHSKDEKFLQAFEGYAVPVAVPQPADIAVWKAANTYSHAAIVTAWPRVIHADIRQGVVRADARQGRLGTFPVRFYSVFEGK